MRSKTSNSCKHDIKALQFDHVERKLSLVPKLSNILVDLYCSLLVTNLVYTSISSFGFSQLQFSVVYKLDQSVGLFKALLLAVLTTKEVFELLIL